MSIPSLKTPTLSLNISSLMTQLYFLRAYFNH